MIINRRIFRELKNNFVRYLAVFLLVSLSMCIVVGFAGSSESILDTVKNGNIRNCVEDGEFSLYIPLQESVIDYFKKEGVIVEPTFYTDVEINNNSTLRIFKNRDSINLIDVHEGRVASGNDELFLEKNYATKNGYKVGDSITVLNKEYHVVGVGSAPDYNFVKENIADLLIDTQKFSIAFVSEEEFQDILTRTDKFVYNYSYRFNENANFSVDDIKDYLLDMTFAADEINDEYYLELLDEVNEEREEYSKGVRELTEGVGELADGCQELSDGIGELSDGVGEIYDGCNELNESIQEYRDGVSKFSTNVKNLNSSSDQLVSVSSQIFSSLLMNTQNSLSAYGINVELTEANYKETLMALAGSFSDNQEYRSKIEAMIVQLDGYNEFKNGLVAYTSGVSNIAEFSNTLNSVTEELTEGVNTLTEALEELNDKSSNDLVDGMAELKEGVDELVKGVNEYNDELEDKLDEVYKVEYVNISSFIESEDNPRLNDYREDSLINRNAAIAVGVILIVLIAYVLSVFIHNNIERESSVIGTLYAQGYVKKELMFHFMILPVAIAIMGSICGTAAGFCLQNAFAAENMAYYSYPDLQIVYKPYLLVYGIVTPIFLVLVINMLVINKKLSLEPLSLLRKEQKNSQIGNINLHNMNFINRYRIRQIMRELRINITMFFGLSISILLLVFSACIYCSLDRYSEKIADDINYTYMYTLKYPLSEKPENVQEGVIKSLGCFSKLSGTELNVSLLGVNEDSPYFKFNLDTRKDEIIISDSVALKFDYKVGDTIILSDKNEEKKYVYVIKEIVPYSNGLYVFKNIEDLREEFNLNDEYYNVLFTDSTIEVPESRLITVTTKDDVVKVADSFVSLISTLIILLLALSVILFIIVMYMLMKVVIERSVFSISLLKIFGYNNKEIRKLYLGSAFYIVILATIFAVPVSKLILNKLYPILVANLSSGMLTYISPVGYVAIVGVIFVSYFIVNLLLSRSLNKVSFVETLKSRE